MSKEEYLTTGQLAKRTGMTLRSLRYYDQIGLLSPEEPRSGTARKYSMNDLKRLEKIQTLKYVGLSLEEIKVVLATESLCKWDIKKSLKAQLDILRRKISHTEHVVHAISDSLEALTNGPKELGWNLLVDVIQAVHKEQDWAEQYLTANRLRTRIHLYDKYSMNPHGWHRWVFDQMEKRQGAHVLELGSGDGTLWVRNAERIPDSWRITLSDMSEGMLDEARSNLGKIGNIKFLSVDAQQIPFHDELFDIVIANNMLYHVSDIPRAISEMHRVLKPGGELYVSTMSKRHLQEVEQLAVSFDPGISVLDRVIDRFHFDNGSNLLSACFSDLKLLLYEDHLLVKDADPLIDYMISTPMNARERLSGVAMDEFRAYLNGVLVSEGPLEITKENGMFLGRK